jgi:hypothetical protein
MSPIVRSPLRLPVLVSTSRSSDIRELVNLLWRTHQVRSTRTDGLTLYDSPPHHIGRLDTLFLLPVWAVASLILIGLTLAYRPVSSWIQKMFGRRKTYAPIFEDDEDDGQAAPTATYMPSKGLFNDFKSHVDDIGRYIFGFELARLACLMALLGLSIYATIFAEAPSLPKNRIGSAKIDDGSLDIMKKKHAKHRKNKHRNNSTLNDLSTQEWAEFSVSVFYVGVFLRSVGSQLTSLLIDVLRHPLILFTMLEDEISATIGDLCA